ncbi:MAG: hypothetical protein JWM57_3567 [Phycisphaerales bacterium]|nr:hypothetical protein [Phycisphaerales bacterium]
MKQRHRNARSNRTSRTRTAIEALENRRLMSVVTINGTSGDNTFVLQAGKPGDTIVYNGNGGHDKITIESKGSVGTIFANVKLMNTSTGTWDLQLYNVEAGGVKTVTAADGKINGVINGVVDFSQTKLQSLAVVAQGATGSKAAIDEAVAPFFNEFHFQGDWGVNIGAATGKLDGIKVPLQVSDDYGTGTLHVSDLSDAANRNITLTDKQIIGLSPKPITYGGFNKLSVLAGSGDKTVAITGTSVTTAFTSFSGNDTVSVGNNGKFDKFSRSLNVAALYGKMGLTYDRSKDTNDNTWTIDNKTISTSGIGVLLTYGGNATVKLLTGIGHDTVTVNNTNANEFYLNTGPATDRVTIFAATGHVTVDTGTQDANNQPGDDVDNTDGTKGAMSWLAGGLSVKNAETFGLSDLSSAGGHHYTLSPGALFRDGKQMASFSGELMAAMLGSGGNDYLDAYGFDKPVLLEGFSGNDVLQGTAFNDILQGQLGNDTLVGGGGNDHLTGDEGNDLLDATGDGPGTTVKGGTGTDTLRTDSPMASVSSIEIYQYPGVVSGTVFADTNKNGTWNVGEVGKKGVQVWVDVNHSGTFDYGDLSAFTDSSGKYTIRDIDAGIYNLNVLPPFGYKQTTAAGAPTDLSIFSQTKLTGLTFGVAPK